MQFCLFDGCVSSVSATNRCFSEEILMDAAMLKSGQLFQCRGCDGCSNAEVSTFVSAANVANAGDLASAANVHVRALPFSNAGDSASAENSRSRVSTDDVVPIHVRSDQGSSSQC